MAETNKPNIIINEDLDLLSTNILNLTLETNKQSFSNGRSFNHNE
jgi:hypothetical protein